MPAPDHAGGPITVGIVDDEYAQINSLKVLAMANAEVFRVVAEAPSVAEFIALGVVPDVLLLDLFVDGDTVLTSADIPRLAARGSTVLVHTREARPVRIIEALEAGAAGVVLKWEGPRRLVEAITTLAAGGVHVNSAMANAVLQGRNHARLTEREVEVVQLLADGLDQAQVAEVLVVEPSTVKEHMKHIAAKYRALGRAAGGPGGRHTLRSTDADGYEHPSRRVPPPRADSP